MKAIRFHEYGDINVLRYEETQTPQPGGGEALVAVAATAFNPVDTWLRAGVMRPDLALCASLTRWALTLPEQSSTTAPASRIRPSGPRSSASFP